MLLALSHFHPLSQALGLGAQGPHGLVLFIPESLRERAGDAAGLAERLPSMQEVLGSIPRHHINLRGNPGTGEAETGGPKVHDHRLCSEFESCLAFVIVKRINQRVKISSRSALVLAWGGVCGTVK